jgi:3-oxoacyl-[acyl-carrier protein] reductase
MNTLLQGRVAIVTGANQGLGLAIAKAYLEAGVSGLAICGRTQKLVETAEGELRSALRPGQKLFAETADISRAAAVGAFVTAAHAHLGRVDILVNNAGVYGPKGAVEDVDWPAWVQAIEINVYGSILMCRAVLPYLKAQRYGKIVQLSGGGATNPLPRLSAYAVSKAAIVRFAETLAEEVREDRIDVNAIAPGALNTRMLEEVLEAGPGVVGQAFYDRSVKQKQAGGTPLEKGADLAVFLASALSDGITGKLISAVWDPWATLPEHFDDLDASDIYTLRRIVPADRGKKWGSET